MIEVKDVINGLERSFMCDGILSEGGYALGLSGLAIYCSKQFGEPLPCVLCRVCPFECVNSDYRPLPSLMLPSMGPSQIEQVIIA